MGGRGSEQRPLRVDNWVVLVLSIAVLVLVLEAITLLSSTSTSTSTSTSSIIDTSRWPPRIITPTSVWLATLACIYTHTTVLQQYALI